MKATNIFGGAMINWSVGSAAPETPVDCKIAPQVQAFLSLMEKAYLCAADEEMERFLKAFVEEVNTYLDDIAISREVFSAPTAKELDELEALMARLPKKEGKT